MVIYLGSESPGWVSAQSKNCCMALVAHYLKRPLQQPLQSQPPNAHGCQQEDVRELQGRSSMLHALTCGHLATRAIEQMPRHALGDSCLRHLL